MDQGRYGHISKEEQTSEQGRYGENGKSPKDNFWVCPECETINTEDECILCGYKKNLGNELGDDFGKWKKLIIIFAVLACIIAGGILTWIITNRENEVIGIYEAMHKETADVQVGIATVPIQKVTDNAWENNILMNCGSDQENAFGSDIPKRKIASVIFLNTTLDAPGSAWDISKEKNNSVLAWRIKNGTLYDIYIAGEGGINILDLSGFFSGFQNLRAVNFNDCVHTSEATDMSFLFAECHKLKGLDLSSIDTSNVDNMNSLFYNCSNLSELDLSSFDTSNVVSMMSMFEGCTNLQYVDLHTFNTEKVVTMGSMFSECESLLSVKLDHFVTTNVVDMNSMFFNCQSLSTVDLRSFDTHRVIDMQYMFYGRAISVNADGTEDFLGPHEILVDEEKFDTSNVIDYEYFHWPEAQLNELPWEEFFASNKSA